MGYHVRRARTGQPPRYSAMSTYSTQCTCGELFHVSSPQTLAKVRCRRCGRIVELRPPRRRRSRMHQLTIGVAALSRIFSDMSAIVRRREQGRAHPPGRLTKLVRAGAWAYLAFAIALTLVLWIFGD